MQTRGLFPFVVASALASAWACRDADPIPATCPPPRNDNTPCTPGDFCRDPASTCANGGALVFGTEFLCDAKTKLWRRFSVSYDCGDAGASAGVACGSTSCTATQYCLDHGGTGDASPPLEAGEDAAAAAPHVLTCETVPAECNNSPTCACIVASQLLCTNALCSEGPNGVQSQCTAQ